MAHQAPSLVEQSHINNNVVIYTNVIQIQDGSATLAQGLYLYYQVVFEAISRYFQTNEAYWPYMEKEVMMRNLINATFSCAQLKDFIRSSEI